MKTCSFFIPRLSLSLSACALPSYLILVLYCVCPSSTLSLPLWTPVLPSQEELRHFETKVEKHQHYQEQLELSHQKLQHVEALGDKEHIIRNKEKYNSLAEKTREMGYKVGRAHSTVAILHFTHFSPVSAPPPPSHKHSHTHIIMPSIG